VPVFVKFDIENAKREILQKESRKSRRSRKGVSPDLENQRSLNNRETSNGAETYDSVTIKNQNSQFTPATFATPATQGAENRLPNTLEQSCLNLDLTPQQLWRYLSLEDIDDIQSGLIDSATLRAHAKRWSDHPYLVPVGNDLPYPTITKPPDHGLVTCNACQYFKPIKTRNGIGDCAKGLKGSDVKPLFPNAKQHCDSFRKVTR